MSHTYLLELPSKNHHHEGMRLPKLTKAEKPAQPQLATHIETQMNNKPMSSVIIHNLQNNKNTQMQNKTIESIALSININCQNFVMYWFWRLMGFFILLGFHSLVISHHDPTYSAPRQEKARRWVRKSVYFCKILFGFILFLIRYFSSLKWFICCNWFRIEITVETWNPNPNKQFIMTLSFRGGLNQCWLFLLFEEKLQSWS